MKKILRSIPTLIVLAASAVLVAPHGDGFDTEGRTGGRSGHIHR